MDSRASVEKNDINHPSEKKQTNTSITEIVMPFAPLKVKLEDLQPDGRLFTDEQARKIVQQITDKKISQVASSRKSDLFKKGQPFAQRFKKGELGLSYSIIVFEDNYFAIYRGVKQGCHLGAGGFGYVKLVQNIISGEWAVIKLSAAFKDDDHEFQLLQKVDMAIGQLDRIAGYGSEFVKGQQRQHPGYWCSNQKNLVMKLAPGVPLSTLCYSTSTLSDIRLVQIIIQVMKAYEKLDNRKIIHGDLNLSNIFYDFASNVATVIDYGAAKRTSRLVGGARRSLIITEGYAAPEFKYVEGKKKYRYTRQTDIYALGATIIYFLQDEKRDLFCPRIVDSALRSQVYDYCFKLMCHNKAEMRPDTAAVIVFFEKLLISQLNIIPQPLVRVALISLEEYRAILRSATEAKIEPVNEAVVDAATVESRGLLGFFKSVARDAKALLSGPELTRVSQDKAAMEALQQKESKARAINIQLAFLQTLKLFDEVWFVDTLLGDNKSYMAICHEMKSAGIHVGKRCFITNDAGSTDGVISVLNQIQSESDKKVNKYYFVSTVRVANHSSDDRHCFIPVDVGVDMSVTQKIIDDYSVHDIQEEYRVIKDALQSLAGKYNKEATIEGSFSRAILHAVEDFDARFAEHSLSFDYLVVRLARLKATMKELESMVRVEPTRQSSSTLYSLFASRPEVSRESSQQVENIERQYKMWAASYQ